MVREVVKLSKIRICDRITTTVVTVNQFFRPVNGDPIITSSFNEIHFAVILHTELQTNVTARIASALAEVTGKQ